MSGICGIIHFDGAPVAVDALERMAEAAAHRGPDGVGYWSEGGVGLAHLALRITPEEQQEVQPLVSGCGELVIVADARIDNREELIRALRADDRLLKHGGGDSAVSDATLLLAAFRAWGRDCAARLIGDFAFVIWDSRRRRVFAARDAMAMRALYFRKEPNRLLFGTEVKQILGAPGVPRRLFEPAIAAHLAGPYGLPHWTFFEGITQLEPGHALEAGESACRTFRYWDVDPEIRIRYRDEREYAEHFREVFKEAVRCRLRSVKPVGLFLSGGMDSGSIASTAGWLLRHEDPPCPSFRTYSWAFEELSECDERHISSGIVRHYGFEATDISADAWWPLRDYPDHGPDQDEPYAGVYQALVERTLVAAQSDGVGVMMSGDRGDHVIGGPIYDEAGLFQSLRWGSVWRELQIRRRSTGMPLRRAARRFLIRPLAENLGMPIRARVSRSSPPWIAQEFAERVGLKEILIHSTPESNFGDAATRMRYEMIFSRAAVRWVMDAERVESRYGLCFTDPWSDRRVAEHVLATPQWILHRLADSKRLARRAMRGMMPETVRNSVRKIEPESLFVLGLKHRSRGIMESLLTDMQAQTRGFLDAQLVQEEYAAFLRGTAPKHDFWWPLTLEIWLRHYWA